MPRKERLLTPREPSELEALERHYARSPFIKEVCIVARDAPSGADIPLHAVVVPDLQVLRERRIVNLRELIRFELEGLAVSLARHSRLDGFSVAVEPLPRDAAGSLRRELIACSLTACEKRPRFQPPASDPALPDPNVSLFVNAVRDFVGSDVDVSPESHLELDLDIDSLARAELLAGIEERLGVDLSSEDAQCAFTVGELAGAARGAAAGPAEAGHYDWASGAAAGPAEGGRDDYVDEPGVWPALLNKISLSRQEQEALVTARPISARVLFGVARAIRALVFRPEVVGLEYLPKSGPFILAPNHQSYLDPFALVGVLPFRTFQHLFIVGATEYFQSPLTAALAARLNIVPVDPDANLVRAMQAAAFGLRAGKILVLFPEGERSIDGTVRTFRRGVTILSKHVDVPVVPVAIDGMFQIWPRNRRLDMVRCLPFSGHRVRIAFGEPLTAAEAGALQRQVQRLWDGLRAR